jgi:hypothetical protein
LSNIHLQIIGINPNMQAIAAVIAASERELEMSTVTMRAPIRFASSRVLHSVLAGFGKLMAALDRFGAEFARRHLRAQRLSEAAALRAFALQYASHDPRFASDLLAAADRHELEE